MIKKKKLNKLKKVLAIVTIISILFIILLPLNVILEGELLDGEGLAYDVALGHTILSFAFFLTTLFLFSCEKIFNQKNISIYNINNTLFDWLLNKRLL